MEAKDVIGLHIDDVMERVCELDREDVIKFYDDLNKHFQLRLYLHDPDLAPIDNQSHEELMEGLYELLYNCSKTCSIKID